MYQIQLFRERLLEKVHATIPYLWMVLLSLKFFKEIWKNGTRGHGPRFAIVKGKQRKLVQQLQCQEECIDVIPYYLSWLWRAHFIRQSFSKWLYARQLCRPIHYGEGSRVIGATSRRANFLFRQFWIWVWSLTILVKIPLLMTHQASSKRG